MLKIVSNGRLIAAMERGRADGYNHQVDGATIYALDPAHHYPVREAIPHTHNNGRLREVHVRLLVEIRNRNGNREQLLIDVQKDL